jgi:hypothetical protein
MIEKKKYTVYGMSQRDAGADNSQRCQAPQNVLQQIIIGKFEAI